MVQGLKEMRASDALSEKKGQRRIGLDQVSSSQVSSKMDTRVGGHSCEREVWERGQ